MCVFFQGVNVCVTARSKLQPAAAHVETWPSDLSADAVSTHCPLWLQCALRRPPLWPMREVPSPRQRDSGSLLTRAVLSADAVSNLTAQRKKDKKAAHGAFVLIAIRPSDVLLQNNDSTAIAMCMAPTSVSTNKMLWLCYGSLFLRLLPGCFTGKGETHDGTIVEWRVAG